MKLENLNLDKFKSSELKGFEATKVFGGCFTTFELSYDRSTGELCDSNLVEDHQV
jgi:hypothetical protein